MILLEKRTVLMSPCRQYRDLLRCVWDADAPQCAFVGLNPSTADEYGDDPTVRRWRGFARAWGYGGMQIVNLFAYRATDPKAMKAAADPVGPQKDLGSQLALHKPQIVVACWGTHGKHLGRDREVIQQIERFFSGDRFVCLGRNADGSPKHPLYLPSNAQRTPFGGAA